MRQSTGLITTSESPGTAVGREPPGPRGVRAFSSVPSCASKLGFVVPVLQLTLVPRTTWESQSIAVGLLPPTPRSRTIAAALSVEMGPPPVQ